MGESMELGGKMGFGDLYVMCGDKIYRLDEETGEWVLLW
jgi:hypothetical protein